MAEHQALEGQYSNLTFFGVCNPKFPDPPADDKLDTVIFLEAARAILPFLEKFGKAFGLVKKDVAGNIEKIDKQYKKDPERYKFINAIIEEDTGKKDGMTEGCVGVLWLKRGLEFIYAMFKELLIDDKNGVTDENFTPTVNRAYEATLKKYHGWMTQKVIGGVLKFVPYRKDFIQTLKVDPSASSELVLKDLELYGVNLSANIELLNKLLAQSNKDSEEKV